MEAAEELSQQLHQIIHRQGQTDEQIGQFGVIGLHNAVDKFEATLLAELRDLEIYSVSPVGIYSTSALLTNATAMFGDDAVLLPAEVSTEFDEARKSLAFGLYTAAGFHLLRSIEAAVRKYYDALSNGAT
jgi:hypothetical protein